MQTQRMLWPAKEELSNEFNMWARELGWDDCTSHIEGNSMRMVGNMDRIQILLHLSNHYVTLAKSRTEVKRDEAAEIPTGSFDKMCAALNLENAGFMTPKLKSFLVGDELGMFDPRRFGKAMDAMKKMAKNPAVKMTPPPGQGKLWNHMMGNDTPVRTMPRADGLARIEVLEVPGHATKKDPNPRKNFTIISIYGFSFNSPVGYVNSEGLPYVRADVKDATDKKGDAVPCVVLTLGQSVEKVKYVHIGQVMTPEKFGAVLKYLKKAGARYGELKRKEKHFHTLTRKFEV